jgi:hypothetical protein
MVMMTSGHTYTFIQLCAAYKYTYCDLSDGPTNKVDLQHAPHGSRAFWPFTYACNMNTVFTHIEELKGSGANSKAAFINVIGLTRTLSTFTTLIRFGRLAHQTLCWTQCEKVGVQVGNGKH